MLNYILVLIHHIFTFLKSVIIQTWSGNVGMTMEERKGLSNLRILVGCDMEKVQHVLALTDNKIVRIVSKNVVGSSG